MQAKIAVKMLILLALSCSDKELDSVVGERNLGQGEQNPKAPKVVAEGNPPIEIKPYELFVLNPVSTERSKEQINLAQNDTVKKTITMTTTTQSKQESLTARQRRWHTKQVTQTGSRGTTRTETFERNRDKGLLDLLMVIDDSESMETAHGHLQAGLGDLLTHINNSNWKIKVIDVDDTNICEHTLITKNNKSAYGALLANFSASPNAKERTLQKAKAALGLSHSCSPWLRANSTVAVVIVTDEDAQCHRQGAADDRGDGNSFYCGNLVSSFITAFRGLRSNTGLYGILDNQSTCGALRSSLSGGGLNCADSNVTNAGNASCALTNPCFGRSDNYKYNSANYLAQSGSFDKISYVRGNKQAYGQILTSISSAIKAKLQDQFTLAEEANSIQEVKVNGVATSQFSHSGNTLTMTDGGNANDTIEVTYVPKGGVKPFKKILTVGDPEADMGSLIVTVAGNTLTKGTHYTVSGNTITMINVETNFPSGAVAHLKWQKKMQHEQKQQEFRFAGNREIVAGSVSIAGYAASRYRVTSHPNKIIFNNGQEPGYGAKLIVSYDYYARNKLTYTHGYSGTYPVTAVSCSPVPCSLSGSDVVFLSQYFQRGRSVTATLTVQGLQSDRRPLPQHYVADSLELNLGSTKCTAEELVIANQELMLVTNNAQDNGCNMLVSLASNINQDMTLSYLLYTPKQEIEVSMDNLLEYMGYRSETWKVYVAGQKKAEDKDYTVSGRKITFKGNYPPNSKGEIRIFVEY